MLITYFANKSPILVLCKINFKPHYHGNSRHTGKREAKGVTTYTG